MNQRGTAERMLLRRLASNLFVLALIVFAGGFGAAALVRFSPGFASIPEDLDPSLSPETLAALHRQHEDQNPLPVFYARYLGNALHGDFGISSEFNQPVADLLSQRLPETARLVGLGTLEGCFFAALLAWVAVWSKQRTFRLLPSVLNGILLAIPPAVLGLIFFLRQAPIALAIALALLPRLYGALRVILENLYASPALLAARARGARPATIALRYIAGAASSQFAALLGVALVLAFGITIAIEGVCQVPGIGSLALAAAKSRDLPLLSALALLITFFVAFVHTVGELVTGGSEGIRR